MTMCYWKLFWKKTISAYDYNWGHEGPSGMGAWGTGISKDSLLCLLNNKKINKYEKGHKWVPDASFRWSDKFKMLIKSSPDLLEKLCFFEKILITEGPRPRPRHQWWCQITSRRSLDTSEKKLKIEFFDVYDRLWWSSMIIVVEA